MYLSQYEIMELVTKRLRMENAAVNDVWLYESLGEQKEYLRAAERRIARLRWLAEFLGDEIPAAHRAATEATEERVNRAAARLSPACEKHSDRSIPDTPF